MISESWFAIDSDDSPLRNREITTVMLTRCQQQLSFAFVAHISLATSRMAAQQGIQVPLPIGRLIDGRRAPTPEPRCRALP
jgi:hypothetical protein